MFSVCYWNNFIIGNNFGNIFTIQTQETQNANNQFCITANKRSRHSNYAGQYHHSMYLQNSVLYYFGIKHIDFWPSDFCSSTLQETKAVQRMFILKCS